MPSRVSTTQLRAALRDFLSRFVGDLDIADDTPLITGGVIDSLTAVQMIDFVERQCGVTVLDEDLEMANFDSLAAVAAFVERKLAEA